MPRNEGSIDRVLRVVVGIVLVSLALTGPKIVWGWIGVVPILTGLFGYCPAYSFYGIRTCRKP